MLCEHPVLVLLLSTDNSSRDQHSQLIQLKGPHHSFMRKGGLQRAVHREHFSVCAKDGVVSSWVLFWSVVGDWESSGMGRASEWGLMQRCSREA